MQKTASGILSHASTFEWLSLQCKQVTLRCKEYWIPTSNSQQFLFDCESPKRLWLASSCVSEPEVDDDSSSTTTCACNTCTHSYSTGGRGVSPFSFALQCSLAGLCSAVLPVRNFCEAKFTVVKN